MKFELPAGRISLRQASEAAVAFLRISGVEDAKSDAAWLMEEATGLSGANWFLHRETEMTAEQRKVFSDLIEKRATGIPVQQIIGCTWFYGRRFFVNADVLVPRQDTEILVEEALQHLSEGMTVLDLCTGSGCILLTLAAEKRITGTGSDISEKALAVAEENARLLKLSCSWIRSDLFENISGSFHMIVSNPPYIRQSEIRSLPREVRDHEPHLALDGGADGLDFYRKIAAQAQSFLKPGGFLILEIGYDQGRTVPALLRECGWEEIRVVRDLANLDRVVAARRRIE